MTKIEEIEESKKDELTGTEPLQLVDGTEGQRKEARSRAEECSARIQEVLAEYQCRIVPMLSVEQVGAAPGSKALVGATYGIFPEPVD